MSTESQLASDEIMVENTIHILVPGYTEWSTKEYHGPPWRKETWRDRSVYLYYKNHIAVHLLRQKQAYVEETHHTRKYKTLQEVVETYKRYSLITSFEKWNQEKGIVGDAWCQERGTPIATIALTLPQAMVEALQKQITTGTIEQWIVHCVQQHYDNGRWQYLEEKHLSDAANTVQRSRKVRS